MAASDSRSGLGSYDNPRELAAMAASGNNDNHMVDNHIGDNPLLNADILWICKGNVDFDAYVNPYTVTCHLLSGCCHQGDRENFIR